MRTKLRSKDDEYAEYLEEKVSQYLNHGSATYSAEVSVSWVRRREDKDKDGYFLSIDLKDKDVEKVNMVSIGLVDLTVLDKILRPHGLYLSHIGFSHHKNQRYNASDRVALHILYVNDNSNEHSYAKYIGKEYIDENSD